jgi:hypothetical protein
MSFKVPAFLSDRYIACILDISVQRLHVIPPLGGREQGIPSDAIVRFLESTARNGART